MQFRVNDVVRSVPYPNIIEYVVKELFTNGGKPALRYADNRGWDYAEHLNIIERPLAIGDKTTYGVITGVDPQYPNLFTLSGTKAMYRASDLTRVFADGDWVAVLGTRRVEQVRIGTHGYYKLVGDDREYAASQLAPHDAPDSPLVACLKKFGFTPAPKVGSGIWTKGYFTVIETTGTITSIWGDPVVTSTPERCLKVLEAIYG